MLDGIFVQLPIDNHASFMDVSLIQLMAVAHSFIFIFRIPLCGQRGGAATTSSRSGEQPGILHLTRKAHEAVGAGMINLKLWASHS